MKLSSFEQTQKFNLKCCRFFSSRSTEKVPFSIPARGRAPKNVTPQRINKKVGIHDYIAVPVRYIRSCLQRHVTLSQPSNIDIPRRVLSPCWLMFRKTRSASQNEFVFRLHELSFLTCNVQNKFKKMFIEFLR